MRSKSQETAERIKSFIFEYYRDNGRSPTVREVGKAAGISVSIAQKYLVWLRENNEIEYSGRRGISTESTDKLVDNMVSVGVIGDISCGLPVSELVRQQKEAKPGEIVVALLNNKENTLKRYLLNRDGKAYLHPENDRYPDIYPETELSIQGVAVKVLKDLEKVQ